MAAELREDQHEISTLDGSRSLVFGTEDTGYLTLTRPARTTGEVRAADQERPQEDGVAFGRDYTGASSVAFEIGVLTDAPTGLDDGDPYRANLDHLDTLEGWWRDERLRNRPGVMAILRSHEAGQTWRCYGRPRAYEEAAGPLTPRGYTPIVCGFQSVDDRYYSDTVEFVDTRVPPTSEGSIVFPLTSVGNFLFSTTVETAGQSVAHISGARSTWLWVVFHGPCTNPTVSIGGLTIGLIGSLAAGQTATFDPRPWARTVLRSDGANLAGWVDPTTPPMRECKVYPGTYDVVYKARDVTGTSRAVVNWRQARNRP